MNTLGTGIVMALLFLVVGGAGLLFLDLPQEFNRGFAWGGVWCAIFCAWVGPRIGRPKG